MSFYNKYSLLNSDDKGSEVVDENSPLYTLELALKQEGLLRLSSLIDILNYFDLCKVRTGLYHQRPVGECPEDEYMSHDQLTALMIASYLSESCHGKEVWEEIKRQKFGYNDHTSSWRPLHPRDTIYYGMLYGSKAWYLLYPLFLIMMVFDCFGTYYYRPQIDVVIKNYFQTGIWYQNKMVESSGKLLYWTRTVVLMPKTFKILELVVFKTSIFKSWREVFKVYFPNPNHLLNQD